MKKLSILLLIPIMLLCSCAGNEKITKTQIAMDTVCTITADCSEESINSALQMCLDYERLFSRHSPDSDISLLNHYNELDVKKETLEILRRAIYYCQKTNGKYDITIAPVLDLYDFTKQKAPNERDAQNMLYKVDYTRIKVDGNYVNLHSTDIDLSSIVKGYTADKLVDFLKKNGAENGIVNLGGNVAVFGKKYNVGILKPFTEEVMLSVEIQNASAVTSGIYQRCFEKDDKFYHHIIDTQTGMPVDNNLASVTILGKKSSECDILSTVCMILGEKAAKKLINETEGYEAIFIKKDNSVSVSGGLKLKNNKVIYK